MEYLCDLKQIHLEWLGIGFFNKNDNFKNYWFRKNRKFELF